MVLLDYVGQIVHGSHACKISISLWSNAAVEVSNRREAQFRMLTEVTGHLRHRGRDTDKQDSPGADGVANRGRQ